MNAGHYSQSAVPQGDTKTFKRPSPRRGSYQKTEEWQLPNNPDQRLSA